MKKITNKVVTDFRRYLYEEEKADNTIKKYIRDVRLFMEWLGRRELEKTAVLEYKKELCEKYTPSSTNSVLSSLNALFVFMNWHELKVKTLKIQRQIFASKDKELTKAEYERLLAAAKSRRNERLYYLMQTIAATGIRISELRYITTDAVRTGQATINCKGKMRQIFLTKQLCKMLKKYIREKNIKSGSVFVSKNGRPLDRSNIWKMLKNLCETAGVSKDKVFPHNFRHPYVKLKLKILFGLYHSLQSAEILHFPYNLNPFTRIHIHFKLQLFKQEALRQ